MNMQIKWIIGLMIVWVGVGCSLKDNPQVLKDKLADGDDSDSGTGDGDADADTDADSDADADGDTDSDGDTDTDTDADSDSDSNTDSDSGSDSDTGVDTDSWPTCGSDTDSACDASYCDTEAGRCRACMENFACGEGCVNCGETDTAAPFCSTAGTTCVQCNENIDCSDTGGSFCDTDNTCLPCDRATACGTGCVDCTGLGGNTPLCSLDASMCVECNGDTDCAEGNYCDTELHACATCNTDFACGSSCDNCTLTAQTPICRADGAMCVQCNNSSDCDTDTPVCDTTPTANTCHECLTDTDCRADSAPNPSPLGICTPDKTCTCWVNGSNLTANCTSTSCPVGFVCAEDLSGSNHYACLSSCSTSSTAINGIVCESRASGGTTIDVWAPMTTCYAFEQFGVDCSDDADVCSVDGAGGISDSTCVDGQTCQYICWDSFNIPQDSWCPAEAPVCGTTVSSPYCQ